MADSAYHVLEMQHISKRYGRLQVLQDFNLSLEGGRILGMIGANGSGKTTVLKIAVGLEKADCGEVYICGERATKHNRKVYRNIGYVPGFFGLYKHLRVSEYMLFFAQAVGLDGILARRQISEVLRQVNLLGRDNEYVDQMSLSVQRRLVLAANLLHSPKLLLMDIPTAGIDTENRMELKEVFRNLAAEGRSMVITSHILPELMSFCTDVGMLVNGSLFQRMTMEELRIAAGHNKPIRIEVADKIQEGVRALRDYPMIRTISSQKNQIRLTVTEGAGVENEILHRLVNAEVPVLSFQREEIDLEAYLVSCMEKEKNKA